MVRTKNKILAEVNDTSTIKCENELLNNSLITKDDINIVKSLELGNVLLYTINDRVVELSIEPNKRLGVNESGYLAWL